MICMQLESNPNSKTQNLSNSQKLNWFESTKNMIKLYFPEIKFRSFYFLKKTHKIFSSP